MTLKKVEFVQPAGTYCNIDERYTQSTPSYATIAYNATAMPFCDGNDFYGHLLRDEEGNTCKLYTTTWFLDRFAALVPEGSGPLTGIVTKYYKQSTGEVYIIRLRRHEDNRVSSDASTRMSKTLIQFGPFDDTNTYDKLTPRVGSGQLTTTMWSAVQAGAGGISMDWGWSYARMAPATVTVKSDGSQSISPALSNSYTNFNVLACVSCQYFWDCTASTMNRTDAPEGYKGECWVFHVNDFTPDASKDLYLTFALASSQTGPMYFDIEWGGGERPAVGVHQDRRNHLARLVLVPPVAAVHPQTPRRDEEQAEVHDPLPRHPQLERRQRHGERQFDGEHDRRQGRRPAHQLLADRRDIRTSKKRNEP